MTDPELRRVEPTGNPRVDALIDGLVCPSCRTIYNAAKAGCADLWHHDNQPPLATGGVVTWADAAELATASMREQEARRSALADRDAAVSLDDVTMRYTKEDLDGARERGVAEGRRQATEDAYGTTSNDLGDGYQELELGHGRWYHLDELGVRVMVELRRPYTLPRWKPLVGPGSPPSGPPANATLSPTATDATARTPRGRRRRRCGTRSCAAGRS